MYVVYVYAAIEPERERMRSALNTFQASVSIEPWTCIRRKLGCQETWSRDPIYQLGCPGARVGMNDIQYGGVWNMIQ